MGIPLESGQSWQASASEHCRRYLASGVPALVRNPPPPPLPVPPMWYPNKAYHLCQINNIQSVRVRKNRTVAARGQQAQQLRCASARLSTKLTVSGADIEVFFRLLEDNVVRAFLERDTCRKYADRYLLAMVFTYFIRAHYTWQQFTRYNFFVALYLAHDMEEDDEEFKFEVLPWLYGAGWRRRYPVLLRHREHLWRLIGHRAVVSRKCCDEVISIRPSHPVWRRHRPDHHSGAIREYAVADNLLGPFGPHRIPPACCLCESGHGDPEALGSDDSGVAFPADSPSPAVPSGGGAAAAAHSPAEGDSAPRQMVCSPTMDLSDSVLTADCADAPTYASD